MYRFITAPFLKYLHTYPMFLSTINLPFLNYLIILIQLYLSFMFISTIYSLGFSFLPRICSSPCFYPTPPPPYIIHACKHPWPCMHAYFIDCDLRSIYSPTLLPPWHVPQATNFQLITSRWALISLHYLSLDGGWHARWQNTEHYRMEAG